MIVRMYIGDDFSYPFYSSDNRIGPYIVGPKLKMELGKSGSLEFTVLPVHENPYFNSFERMKTIITVYEGNDLIFRGRALSISSDFYKQKKITCEGDLSFLLDSIMEPYEHTKTIRQMFTDVISNHNEQMTGNDYKKFTVGNVTVPHATDQVKFEITSFEDSSSIIESELIDSFGGILQTRTESGVHYIDYIADPYQAIENYPENQTQQIAFGVNLLDIQSEPPVDEVFTILLPIGKDKDVNIKSVNNDSKFLVNDAAVAKYGRIIRCEQWSDISNKSTLKAKAQEFLNIHSVIYNDDLTIKAVDLHYLDGTKRRFGVGDRIRCYSQPHNLDVTMVCLEAEYDITNPENNTYKIGTYVPSDEHDGNKIVKKKSNKKKKSKLSKITSKNAKKTEENRLNVNKESGATASIQNINDRKIQIGADPDLDVVSINSNIIDLTGLINGLIDQRIGP